MLMNYHQCSIMLVQLQGYIIANIQVYVNIILMYVCNIYLGISSPPQFPDANGSGWVRASLGQAGLHVDTTWGALDGVGCRGHDNSVL